MEQGLPDLDAAGIRVAAISVDDSDASRQLAHDQGYTFTLLSDPDLTVSRQYDVVDPIEQAARPAEFLIDPAGVVRWRHLAESIYIRARPEDVLRAAAALK